MSLSCDCDYDGDFEWYYYPADDFSALDTKRARKCCSCKARIAPGDTVLMFGRTRGPRNDIEELIYGSDTDAVPLAPWWMCETCGGLYMAVDELGFCCDISQSIAEQIKEYRRAA